VVGAHHDGGRREPGPRGAGRHPRGAPPVGVRHSLHGRQPAEDAAGQAAEHQVQQGEPPAQDARLSGQGVLHPHAAAAQGQGGRGCGRGRGRRRRGRRRRRRAQGPAAPRAGGGQRRQRQGGKRRGGRWRQGAGSGWLVRGRRGEPARRCTRA
jgi:hypothetical protein